MKRRRPPRRRRRRRLLPWLAVGAGVVLAALAAAAAGVVAWAERELERPRGTETIELTIDRGAPMTAILDQLAAANVVGDPLLARLTLRETAEHLASEGFGELDAFLAAMSSPGLIADLDPEAESLEGYLFPDTYAFPRGTGEADIVDAMVRNFRRRVEDHLDAAAGHGLDPRGLVTLASIVEKEAGAIEERPLVSAVFHNRLERGIGLYADPTIIYALKMAGTWDGNLRRRDLELDSPYNTYVHPGLPPGPICSPGEHSLRAAARPADVPYLYFVSRNDGTHVFAETLAEHNRNVARWQVRYWRERR